MGSTQDIDTVENAMLCLKFLLQTVLSRKYFIVSANRTNAIEASCTAR